MIRACGSSELRPGGTWLSPEMRAAYLKLHRLGFAHSVETWQGERLVGGLYGVALGAVFFGESMFSIERDASKVALKRLCDELIARGFHMIDCQMATPHLLSLGAQLIPRPTFIDMLADHVGDAAHRSVGRMRRRHPLTAIPRPDRRPRCKARWRAARSLHCPRPLCTIRALSGPRPG